MSRQVVVGEVVGAFGVRGWVKIRSYTDPANNILKYGPWMIRFGDGGRAIRLIEGRPQGAVVLARLEGVADRDQAGALSGAQVVVPRECFPKSSQGEYYWADLVGLEVLSTNGPSLGKVVGLLETGANDVLEVRGDRERLIPFVLGEYIKELDLEAGYLIADWDPDF